MNQETQTRQPDEFSPRRISACLHAFKDVPTSDIEGKTIEEYVSEQAYIKNLDLHGAGINAELSGMACQMLAASFAGQFKGTGAINFLEVQMRHPEIGNFTVTIQKSDGLTPGQLKKAAESEAQALRTENEKLKRELEVLKSGMVQLTLNAKQLREAREFVFNEDGDEVDYAAVIAWLPASLAPLDDNKIRMKEGLYCWDAEYPEEGTFPLFDDAFNSEGVPA